MFHYDPSIDSISDNADGISVLVRDSSSYLHKKVKSATIFFQIISKFENCMQNRRNVFERNKTLKIKYSVNDKI